MYSNGYKKLESTNHEKIFVSVVEDEEDIAYIFRDGLAQINGVEVFAFTNPLLALEHFKANHQKYGVVISDNRMPRMTGIELFMKMKEINPLPRRIMITCYGELNHRVQNTEFEDCWHKFFQKPVPMATVIAEVEKQIKSIQDKTVLTTKKYNKLQTLRRLLSKRLGHSQTDKATT